MAITQVTFKQVTAFMLQLNVIQKANPAVKGLTFRAISTNVKGLNPFIQECEEELDVAREECIVKDPEGKWVIEERENENGVKEPHYVFKEGKEDEYRQALEKINQKKHTMAFLKITEAAADNLRLPFNQGTNFDTFFNLMVEPSK